MGDRDDFLETIPPQPNPKDRKVLAREERKGVQAAGAARSEGMAVRNSLSCVGCTNVPHKAQNAE